LVGLFGDPLLFILACSNSPFGVSRRDDVAGSLFCSEEEPVSTGAGFPGCFGEVSLGVDCGVDVVTSSLGGLISWFLCFFLPILFKLETTFKTFYFQELELFYLYSLKTAFEKIFESGVPPLENYFSCQTSCCQELRTRTSILKTNNREVVKKYFDVDVVYGNCCFEQERKN
jgi:hypothetical protein